MLAKTSCYSEEVAGPAPLQASLRLSPRRALREERPGGVETPGPHSRCFLPSSADLSLVGRSKGILSGSLCSFEMLCGWQAGREGPVSTSCLPWLPVLGLCFSHLHPEGPTIPAVPPAVLYSLCLCFGPSISQPEHVLIPPGTQTPLLSIPTMSL